MEIPGQVKASSADAPAKPENKAESSEKPQASGEQGEFPRTLVKGPIQPQPVAKTTEPKRPLPGQEEDPKNALEQLKDNVENVGKALNPFRW